MCMKIRGTFPAVSVLRQSEAFLLSHGHDIKSLNNDIIVNILAIMLIKKELWIIYQLFLITF